MSVRKAKNIDTNRVSVASAHPDSSRHARRLATLGTGFLEKLELKGCELSLSLVTDRAIRRLNRTWRQKDKATDVLSFPAGDLPKGFPGPRPLGDVVISVDTAKRQAKERGIPLQEELALYLAHGLLHLLGHDHEKSAAAARKMAKLEEKLLGSGGMLHESPELEKKPARATPARAKPAPAKPSRAKPSRAKAAPAKPPRAPKKRTPLH